MGQVELMTGEDAGRSGRRSGETTPATTVPPSSRRNLNEPDAHLRKLTDTLRENLGKCAVDPDEDAVHDTRTGTRRIEAALEAELRNAGLDRGDGSDELTKTARAWERLLKTVRRAAAPVRDLDVQRKLLKAMIPATEAGNKIVAEQKPNEITVQADKLDDALKVEREHQVVRLKKNAAKWAAKLENYFVAYSTARHPLARRCKRDAAQTALDAFARLAYEMRQLDAGNLHDFRKGAKKARYMAEQGGDDERAGMVGKALKKLQDEIGAWHDWVMLDEEAHKHLDASGAELMAQIKRKRDGHFEMAMEMERKMRGRLIGEGLAVKGARRTGTRALVTRHGLESQKSIESA